MIFIDLYLKFYKQIYLRDKKESIKFTKKIKLGLLTNEIPPIVYGGVAYLDC